MNDDNYAKKQPTCQKFPKAHLNKSEVMCMKYLLQNFNSHDIAKKMGLSFRTINFHITNVMLQFKCENLTQLIKFLKENE